ncbi:hypothetical protein A9K72_25490 [Mesorhizobium loti]|nr:hypothetical protein A9K72_25490 [Mesorhizobium loti]
MAATPYILPRETRESAILVGNGTAGPYAPSPYRIFDIADVKVFAKAFGETVFSDVTAGCTIAKVDPASAYDFFTVTFGAAVPASTAWYHQARRVANRSVAVTRGGTLDSNQLEQELSKEASVESEVRRDIDRAASFPRDFVGQTGLPPAEAGKVLAWNDDGDRLVNKSPVDLPVDAIVGAAGLTVIGKNTVPEIRDFLDTPAYVASRAELAALDGAKDKVAIIWNEGGRNGRFVFSSSNLSTPVTADTAQGIYVAPASAPTGASGAWVRQNDGVANAAWYGLDRSNTAAANTAALTAAMNFVIARIGALRIPGGDYDLNAISVNMTVSGQALHVTGDGAGETNLRWNGTDGIVITTSGPRSWVGGSGNAVTFHRLGLVNTATTGAAGRALSLDGTSAGNFFNPALVVSECSIRSTTVNASWAKGVELTSVGSATIEKTFWYGAQANNTLGIFVDLIASAGHDASPYHIRGCEGYFCGTFIRAGSYIEGVHVTDCDFVGGYYGIDWDATVSGGEAQLCMVGTHINVHTRAVRLNLVEWSQITGCLLWTDTVGGTVVELIDSSSTTITGNSIAPQGLNSICIDVKANTWNAATFDTRRSTIVGNVFEVGGTDPALAVNLAANVRGFTVANNPCDTLLTECSDPSYANNVHWTRDAAWTPIVTGATTAGAATGATVAGRKRRRGNKIEFSCNIAYTGHSGTGPMQVNMPDTASVANGIGNALSVYCAGAGAVFTGAPQALIGSGGTNILLRQAVSGTAATSINITNGALTMVISGEYAVG